MTYHRFTRAASFWLSLIVLVLYATATAGAQERFEINGTVVGMSSGFIGIRDLHCRVHGLDISGHVAVWNGHPFRLYDPSYANKNVHVVAVHRAGYDELVSAQTQRGPSAPRNCTTYSAVRQLEGVLTAYSMGSSLGSFTVRVDTGDDVIFPFSILTHDLAFSGTGGLQMDFLPTYGLEKRVSL